jgi:co-chaperonin GroES (HSP10)
MKNLRALGMNVVVKTDLQEHENVTKEGIIYKESQLDSKNVILWSEVHSVGPDVILNVKQGDWVCWKLDSAVGHYKVDDVPYDLIPFDRLLLVRDVESNEIG